MNAYVRRIARMCCANCILQRKDATSTVKISAKMDHCKYSFAKSIIMILPRREIYNNNCGYLNKYIFRCNY
jgi:hypothetical protein